MWKNRRSRSINNRIGSIFGGKDLQSDKKHREELIAGPIVDVTY